MDENKLEIKTANKGNLLAFIKGVSKKTKLVTVLSLVFVIVVGAFVLIMQNNEGQLTTISESSLQKIIEIN